MSIKIVRKKKTADKMWMIALRNLIVIDKY